MSISREEVLNALRTVNDPELHRDLVSLNMIKDITIDDHGKVGITVTLTTPACPMKSVIEGDVKAAVMRLPGVKKVEVNMTSNVTATKRPVDVAGSIKNIIGVTSGKGGVGKTTVAVNLALALARSGASVGLLDADIYGPNVPIMLGVLHEQPALRQGKDVSGADVDIIIPVDKFGIKIMSMGFLIDQDQPVVWRGPMLNSVLRQFLGQVDWGTLDYLVVDLPPGTGDVQISLIQLVKLTGVVVVTTPQPVALQDVRKGLGMFKSQNVPILGIIENMSYFCCPHCKERTEIFSHGGGQEMAAYFSVPFLGEIPLAGEVRAGADAGQPLMISSPDSAQGQIFTHVAEHLAAQISIRNHEQGCECHGHNHHHNHTD